MKMFYNVLYMKKHSPFFILFAYLPQGTISNDEPANCEYTPPDNSIEYWVIRIAGQTRLASI